MTMEITSDTEFDIAYGHGVDAKYSGIPKLGLVTNLGFELWKYQAAGNGRQSMEVKRAAMGQPTATLTPSSSNFNGATDLPNRNRINLGCFDFAANQLGHPAQNTPGGWRVALRWLRAPSEHCRTALIHVHVPTALIHVHVPSRKPRYHSHSLLSAAAAVGAWTRSRLAGAAVLQAGPHRCPGGGCQQLLQHKVRLDDGLSTAVRAPDGPNRPQLLVHMRIHILTATEFYGGD
jgi:hypothetical protein